MDVGVLGPLEVIRGGRDLTPRGRLQRAVLLRLLLDANTVVPVDVLAEDVFDDERERKNPGAALQVHVSRLRKALADGNGHVEEVIARIAPGYRLCLGPHDVDAWRFERLVTEAGAALAKGEPEAAAEMLATALGLWRGPPLGEFNYAQWAQPEVARLEDLRLGAFENLVEARLALGGHHEMVPQLRAMADQHPRRERLWGQLMRALYLDGRQTEALRAYQHARRVLDEEVGLAPCRELQDLEEAILRQDPALHRAPSASDRTGGTEGPRHMQEADPQPLPRSLTRFVGREAVRAELATVLSTSRLVTLTGMAGVGKTRLALEMASGLAQNVEAREVRLVELAGVSDPALVVPAVAAAVVVGRRDRDFADVEMLIGAVGRRELLVLLDNCEHLRDACAEVAMTLLTRCPNVQILATSQAVLGVPGEATWQLPPLSLPPPHVVDASPEDLLAAESVQLFCDRAGLVRPGFALSKDNCDAVATICRRLDGVPLAIELAAAAVAMLSVWEISALLDDRFNLLTTDSHWVAGRHRTLLAAVDWSHNLLSNREQVLLRRLAVFAGGATLGSVEEVCAGQGLAASEIFGLASGLVAKSLVVADTGGREARYRLLETVRAYAADRLLEAGEHAVAAECHARWCVGLAERAEPELTAADQRAWHERLEADHDNARAALDWALAERRQDLALRLSGALTLFWSHRGHHREGREWLERCLMVGAASPAPLRAKALWGVGQMCVMLNEHQAGALAAAESLDLWRSCGNTGGQARALLVLGHSGESHGGLTALQALGESARLAREAGDLWCLAKSLVTSGWAQLNRGELCLARPFFNEAVGAARQAGDEPVLTPVLMGLGYVALHSGDYRTAGSVLAEALALARRGNQVEETLVTLRQLAALAKGSGDSGSARSLLGEALGLARRMKPSQMPHCLCDLGHQALWDGDTVEAETCLAQARVMIQAEGGTLSPVDVGLAEIHLARGDLATATALLENAFAQARAKGNVVGVADVVSRLGDLARAEGDLEEATSRHRWALGQRFRIENLPGAVCSLESLASLAVVRDEPHLAARLFGFAESLRTSRGYAPAPVQRERHQAEMAFLQKNLSDEDLTAAWAEGAHSSVADAVADALGTVERQRFWPTSPA